MPAEPCCPVMASWWNGSAVSRTVLREAMKTLTAKGMIIPKARIGTRVTERSNWNLF